MFGKPLITVIVIVIIGYIAGAMYPEIFNAAKSRLVGASA